MSNLVYLQNHIAINEVKNILGITSSEANDMFFSLSEDKTLASALRLIGFKSVKQISTKEWSLLRQWRGKYFKRK